MPGRQAIPASTALAWSTPPARPDRACRMVSSDRPANERGVTQTLDMVHERSAGPAAAPMGRSLPAEQPAETGFLATAWTEPLLVRPRRQGRSPRRYASRWRPARCGRAAVHRETSRISISCVSSPTIVRITFAFLCEVGTEGLEQELLEQVLATIGSWDLALSASCADSCTRLHKAPLPPPFRSHRTEWTPAPSLAGPRAIGSLPQIRSQLVPRDAQAQPPLRA